MGSWGMRGCGHRLTQHKRFMPGGIHPNFYFTKTSFMQETLYEIADSFLILILRIKEDKGEIYDL